MYLSDVYVFFFCLNPAFFIGRPMPLRAVASVCYTVWPEITQCDIQPKGNDNVIGPFEQQEWRLSFKFVNGKLFKTKKLQK